jgi:hypothetical protein
MDILSNITEEQLEVIHFLNESTKGTWSINRKTGLVDIDGNFRYHGEEGKELKDFKGVRFGVVTGDFDCCHNNLTSLVGAPQKVGGDFHCGGGHLTSLVGAPRKVGGYFHCHRNNLTSLVGAPQVVKGDFHCESNNLTSLEGAPQEVGGAFNCSRNKLTSLEGAPQEVGRDFNCHSNNLTSLVGAPQVVKGDFCCGYNHLTSLEGAPQKVGGYFYCFHNEISEKTLKLVLRTMKEKKIDYWTALCILKSEIQKSDFEKLEGELDKRLSQDAQKGYSTLVQFGFFK